MVEVRNSHGEVTLRIVFPDGYYVGASTDAGGLEWQTKPSTLPEVRNQAPRLQKEVYDRAKSAGATMRVKALGGHETFSGFADDTFWYGNFLKYRDSNPDLDWGFFGKDGYNATPVALWDHGQQERYAAVHAEHDLKWEKFLKKLETALDQNTSIEELMKIYKTRDVMGMEEYSRKLSTIFHNADQETRFSKLIGKRSKFKYVALRPGNGLVEKRAHGPQKMAAENVKISEFTEAEVWHVKDRISKGFEVKFRPFTYFDKSDQMVVRNTKKITQDLGLPWKDFVGFSKVGDVRLKGNEKSINWDFTPNEYGAGKRDALYRKLRDRILQKSSWSNAERIGRRCES